MSSKFYEMLDLVCERPPMYLGTTSISVLSGWISGWQAAAGMQPWDADEPDFRKFNDFVKDELDYYESTRGWRRMILEKSDGDESAAFLKFVELFQKFKASHSRTVV